MKKPIAIRAKASYHHGQLQQALIGLSLQVIAGEGLENLTLRALGKRLGVSPTALYRHFADKDALLERIALEGFIEFDLQLEAARNGKSPVEALIAMLMSYVRFARTHPAHFQVMFSRQLRQKPHPGELRKIAEHSFSLLEAEVRRGIAAGRFASTLSPAPAAIALWSMAHGFATLRTNRNFKRTKVQVEESAAFAANALLLGFGAS